MQTTFTIPTRGQGLYDFTDQVAAWATGTGLLTLFIRHTSASLLIQENADPDVQRDLAAFFHRLVPPSDDPSMSYLRHTSEGPDDMPSHIRMALTRTSEVIPIMNGSPVLGTWQGLFLFEHRRAPHTRKLIVSIIGE